MSEGASLYEPYIGKFVEIGIPNYMDPNRLFIIPGTVLSVDDGYILLKIKDGFRKIPYDDVREIREKRSPIPPPSKTFYENGGDHYDR
jgi:hypothetical protein